MMQEASNVVVVKKIHIAIIFVKTILFERNLRPHDVLNGLNLIKFVEIFNSNETPNVFFT